MLHTEQRAKASSRLAPDIALDAPVGKSFFSQIARKTRRLALFQVAPSLLTRNAGFRMLDEERAYYRDHYAGRRAGFGLLVQKLHWAIGNVMMAKDMTRSMPLGMALNVAAGLGGEWRARNRRFEALLKSPFVRLEGEELVLINWHICHGGREAAEARRAARLGARRDRYRLSSSVARQKNVTISVTYAPRSRKHKPSGRECDKHPEPGLCSAKTPQSKGPSPEALPGIDEALFSAIAAARAAADKRPERKTPEEPKPEPKKAKKKRPGPKGDGTRRKVAERSVVNETWWQDVVAHRKGFEKANLGPFRRERADAEVVLFAMGLVEGATTHITNPPGALLSAVRELQAGRWVMPRSQARSSG